MGTVYSSILPIHEEFIRKQRIFFVGSAPLSADGQVNISPKGHDVLRIFSPTEVAYLDLTGSGNETSAHLKDNGRITFMFLAFEGPPMILRLYGRGKVVLPGTSEWDEMANHFDILPGARQIIYAKIETVKTSCGFSVPYYSYSGDRDTLQQWATNKSEQELEEYRKKKNSISMDGIVTPIGESIANFNKV
ncbi:pyridoxamine 5'-phosphate oxidase family protein [Bacillus sp. ISL-40]|uniref:pyridoxamine 5'-phosphate oxidase family protein n=1 Tax=unclassified Bacillus (in: firmicutes) TaxID=185979 RepID=UPI001BE8FFA9|nr:MULTISPECIES: pyridoxamine 5'-phosphate oxidase family protein [unclassified Bacillus (in: firmicutes)]MBT2699165.1 pyridoxamine 5'-phosphate oxidase family protein [Bacillus sp. ISL-40]MBT2739381.1 pyridoxamine 5'-phosphate oxidase family protein [Bacillus sp. ISL-77]